MIDEAVKFALIEKALRKNANVLPEEPTIEDLFEFSNLRRPKRWRRNQRLHKKFRKNWSKYVPKRIRIEFMSKVLASPLRRRMDYGSIARKALSVQPLPPGALAEYKLKNGVYQ